MAEKRKNTWYTVWVQLIAMKSIDEVLGKTLILPQCMLQRTNRLRHTTNGHRVGVFKAQLEHTRLTRKPGQRAVPHSGLQHRTSLS